MKVVAPHLTPAQKLFKVGFDIRIPSVYKHPPEQQDYYGRATTGDYQRDKDNMLEEETVHINIDRLVAYYQRGLKSVISFRDVADAAMVYNIIVEHLLSWNNHLRNSLMPKKPNLEDLKALDEIAHYCYIVARHLLDPADKPLNIDEMFGLSMDNPLSPVMDQPVFDKVERDLTYHQPIMPDIVDGLNSRVKPWQ